MRIQRVKDMATGAVLTVLIAGTAVTAYGKISQINIPVNYQNIKIMIDGKQLNTSKEPFIYEGTTYLPVRDVGEALNKYVSWDSDTNTVHINSTSQNTDKNTETKATYSKLNPAPLNTPQEVTLNGLNGSFTMNVTIQSAVRGNEALKAVTEANIFNNNPPSGMEYVLVKIKSEIISQENTGNVNVGNYDFTAYSSDGAKYEYYQAVAPEPKYAGNVSNGQTVEGYAVYCVNQTDSAPKLAIGSGNNQKWFALQ